VRNEPLVAGSKSQNGSQLISKKRLKARGTMRWKQAAPFVSLLLNVVSIFSYAWVGDWHKTVYWIGAAVINVALVF
jgi:hypothetical protein